MSDKKLLCFGSTRYFPGIPYPVLGIYGTTEKNNYSGTIDIGNPDGINISTVVQETDFVVDGLQGTWLEPTNETAAAMNLIVLE